MSRLTNGLLLAGMVRHRALRFSGLIPRRGFTMRIASTPCLPSAAGSTMVVGASP
jgi:hypothetical protein